MTWRVVRAILLRRSLTSLRFLLLSFCTSHFLLPFPIILELQLLTNSFRWSPAELQSFVDSLEPSARKEWDQCSEQAKRVHLRNKHKEKYPLNLNVLDNFHIARSD